jgi:hypothetical protein
LRAVPCASRNGDKLRAGADVPARAKEGSVDLAHLDDAAARVSLKKLVERLQQLNRDSVIPSSGAWRIARRQIAVGAQTYEADKA